MGLPDFLARLRDSIIVITNRWLFLTFAERSLVGRRLSSGSFVPARAFAAGEALFLDPRVLEALPVDARADVVVCRDRSSVDWSGGSNPPDASVIARVAVRGGPTTGEVRLVPHLPHGTFDVLLDLNRDGGFDPGDSIQGTRTPGIVVHEDPATPGPYQVTREELDLGPVTIPSSTIGQPGRDVNIILTLMKPVGVAPGPLAILAHGNGYDRRHTAPLGELLASWGISAAVCEHQLYQHTDQVAIQIEALRARLPGTPAGAGLDTRRPVLLGHSRGGGAVTIVARQAEIALPLAGLVLLDAAYPGTAPLVATPVLGLVGLPHGFSMGGRPGAMYFGAGDSAPWIVEATTSAASLAVVEAALHGDFTYPNGDAGEIAPVLASDGGLDRRRYVAGLAAAFCRRHLLGTRTLDVFLVDGAIAVPSVDARVASRPGRPHRLQLEAGAAASPIARETGGGSGVLVERGIVVDCNLIDPGRTLWFRGNGAGAFVRWIVPASLTTTPSDLSLHVAQVVDQPGIVSLGSSSPFAATRAALDAGRVSIELATAMHFLGIELAGALPDYTGPATVITPGSRWTIRTQAGRTYTLTDVGIGHGFACADDYAPNLPARAITFDVEIVDRAGRRDRIALRVPAAPHITPNPPVSTYTGFRVPLSAFDVDAAALASVAIVAREACEFAIDHVELVTSWD